AADSSTLSINRRRSEPGKSLSRERACRGETMVKKRGRASALVFALLTALAMAACAPAAPPTGSSGSGESSGPSAPQRTLVIAVRGELPSVAAYPLVPVTGALAPPTTLFNAELDYSDERGNPQPYLAVALPKADTDSWKVLTDGRMETTYTLKP